MIESNRIQHDSFQSNGNKNDASSNVATYIAAPDTEQFGGSLDNLSYVTKNKLDLSLQEYLSRPKLMYSGSITTYTTSPSVWNFAYDFLSSADIMAKTKYVHLLRGTFQIKLIVTAAPYATGRISISTMYGKTADYGAPLINTDLIIANLAHKTTASIDLGSANTCMLSVPMHIRKPYVRNEAPNVVELQKMTLFLYTLSNLQNAQTNSTIAASFKLYVSMVDVESSIPVPIAPNYPAFFEFEDRSIGNIADSSASDVTFGDFVGSNSANSDISYQETSENLQATNGVISAPASIIADMAGKLSDSPGIGPFALATQIGANAVAQIARLFGFSRPRDFSKIAYPHMENLSSGIGEVRSKQVTTDPNQEVTIGSSFLGEHGDALSFENTICRPGFFKRFVWNQSDTAGTHIFQLPVSPMISFSAGSGGVNYFAPTPMAYCSALFGAWRGSIKYHFNIPANRFVRGKLRIFWMPDYNSTPTIDLLSNNSLSVLIDLTQTVDLDLIVPYMSDNLYKAIGEYFSPSSAANDNYINGYLVFVVEEALIANNSTWTAEILMFQSAGPDFELAYPTMANIPKQHYDLIDTSASYQSVTFASSTLVPPTVLTSPTDWYTYTSNNLDNTLSNSVNPQLTDKLSLLPESIATEKPAIIHMGEKIPNLRILLKRFYPFMLTPVTTVPNSRSFVTYFIPYLGMPNSIQSISPTAYSVSPYITTPITYLSRMFGGVRGSIRYAMSGGNNGADVFTGRIFEYDCTIRSTPCNNSNYFSILNTYFQGGVNMFKPAYEPVVVDVPYQNYRWFYPTDKRPFITGDVASAVKTYGIGLSSFVTDTSAREAFVYQSAGEDFQFVIYNGPPIVSIYNLNAV